MILVDEKNLAEVIAHLRTCHMLAIDTETTGVRPYHGDLPFSFAVADSSAEYYFNLDPNHTPCLGPSLQKLISTSLFDPKLKIVWIMHNAKFDIAMFEKAGFDVTCFLSPTLYDTMIHARLLNNDRMSLSLDSCAKDIGLAKDDAVMAYIGEHHLWEWEEIPGKGTRSKKLFFNRVPFEIISTYACMDTRITYDLAKSQMARFSRQEKERHPDWVSQTELIKNEAKLLPIIYEMERYGVRVDMDYCHRSLLELHDRKSLAESEFFEVTGIHFKNSHYTFKDVFRGEKILYGKETPTGKVNPRFDSDALKTYTHPAAKVILKWRDIKKTEEFFQGFLYQVDSENRLHSSLNQAGTATGRSCVAKGTPVEMPRDLGKYPKGIPIEKVKPGDMVYTYDSKCNLTLKKVVWAGKTGHRKVIRIHWLGQGRKHRGYLDVTPEHLIRLTNGEYVRAESLKKNMSLLALGRSLSGGYARLHSRDKEYREHRFIFEKMHGLLPEHVHHIDHKKLNNSIDNLQGMSHSEHTQHHGKNVSLETRLKMGVASRLNWKLNPRIMPKGEGVHNYFKASRFTLLKEIARCSGRPTKSGIACFSTFKDRLLNSGINPTDIAFRYGEDGKYLSRGRIKRSIGIPRVEKKLRIGWRRYQRLLVFYGFKAANHIVTSIEQLPAIDVYDLEVEETHNFIAGEICVHNSMRALNLQQLTKDETPDPDDIRVRRALIPDPDYFFAMFDYDQMEYKLMLDYAGAHQLIAKVKRGMDVHQATADLAKISRSMAKTVNFATLYGSGLKLLASRLGVSVVEANKIRRSIFDAAPEIEDFLAEVQDKASRRGFIFNWLGRRYSFPDSRFVYKAPNYLIQGGCADIMKVAMVRVSEYLRSYKSKMVLVIHDECVINVHKDEAHILPDIKQIMEGVYTPFNGLPMSCGVEHSFTSFAERIEGLPP